MTSPKWSEAFIEAVAQATGQSSFTYFTAVTKLVGDVQCWEENPAFSKTMDGNPIKILQLREMLTEIYSEIGTTSRRRTSAVGRSSTIGIRPKAKTTTDRYQKGGLHPCA
ncbi:MAG: hypothetical protein JSS26_09625 [Nitrospira sp.]|nr:hypothetical protein [Nitrospira sp.]